MAVAVPPPPPCVKRENEDDTCAMDTDDDNDGDVLSRRWNVEVEARISLDLNLYICLACAGSKYSSRDKLNLIRHIRAKHLPDFSGFVCELCPRVMNTRRGFESHMGRVHNIVTVHHHQHPSGQAPGSRSQEAENDLAAAAAASSAAAACVKVEEDSIVDENNT